jgi:sulfide dehydrogenase cytochrome subunit
MLANTCAGCHGPDGSSTGPATPSIAGVSEEYMIEIMEDYAKDKYASTIMGRIAKGYTEEEIKAMAKFFAGKKMKTIDQKANSTMATKGKRLHDKYCEKCHEDGGRSAEDDAGILAGQMMPYLANTMEDFHAGTREMPKKMAKKMKSMYKKAGDEGVEALVNYYGSQQ